MVQSAEYLEDYVMYFPERKELLALDFNSINWRFKDKKTENGKIFKEFTCNETFCYGNQQFEIKGEKTQGSTNGKLNMEKIDYKIGLGEHNVVLIINYLIKDNNIEARTFIERFDEGQSLPFGFGMKLYEKLLDSFGEDARQRNTDLIHIEERNPETARREKKMTKGEWDRKFGTLLRQRGYSEVEDGLFQFTYKPN